MNIALPTTQPAPQRVWPPWIFKTILAVLFFGPLAAPLFQATGLPLVADSGALARHLLASYICPTPAKSYVLAGFPMAVCARCWGATIGLWLAWFAYQRLTDDRRMTHGLQLLTDSRWSVIGGRFVLAALPFLLWYAEIVFWPAAPYPVLLVNGAQAGFFAGLFFCAIWPGLHAARSA